jgi:hypothetical protein
MDASRIEVYVLGTQVTYEDVKDEAERTFDFQGEPCSTKAQLERLKFKLHEISSSNNVTKSHKLIDFNGNLYDANVSKSDPERSIYRLKYNNVFNRDLNPRSKNSCAVDHADKFHNVRCAAYISVTDAPAVMQEVYYSINDCEETWRNSDAKRSITELLEKHAKSLTKVTKVVGVELGSPGLVAPSRNFEDYDERRDDEERAYFQYLTLIHIAKAIGRAPGDKGVAVFIHDPDYTYHKPFELY